MKNKYVNLRKKACFTNFINIITISTEFILYISTFSKLLSIFTPAVPSWLIVQQPKKTAVLQCADYIGNFYTNYINFSFFKIKFRRRKLTPRMREFCRQFAFDINYSAANLLRWRKPGYNFQTIIVHYVYVYVFSQGKSESWSMRVEGVERLSLLDKSSHVENWLAVCKNHSSEVTKVELSVKCVC